MDFGYQYGYDYRYDYPITYYDSNETIFAAILSIYLLVLTVVIVFTLVGYIFHSIGLYTIGKRLGKNHAWLAFIPFARDYFHGEMAGEIRFKSREIRNPGIWKLVLPIISGVVTAGFVAITMFFVSIMVFANGAYGIGSGLMMLSVLVTLLMIFLVVYNAVYLVLRVMIDMQIFGRFTTHNMAIVHSVLSVVLPLYEAFCLFVMRNREFNPGAEPKSTVPPVMPEPPAAPEPPVAPGTPVQPPLAQPIAPLDTQTPSTAPQNIQAGMPVQPEDPVQSETPVQPEKPVQSETPVQPEDPVQSETQLQQEAAAQPESVQPGEAAGTPDDASGIEKTE